MVILRHFSALYYDWLFFILFSHLRDPEFYQMKKCCNNFFTKNCDLEMAVILFFLMKKAGESCYEHKVVAFEHYNEKEICFYII